MGEVPVRVTLLANPRSGKGKGRVAAGTAVSALRRAGASVTVRTADTAVEAKAVLVDALKEQPDTVVIVGGDGTISSVLPELIDSRVPVTFVPAGTGNDFARAMGIPYEGSENAATAALVALGKNVKDIDVGEIVCPDGHGMFLTVAALGFDARVSDRTNRLRWPRGALRYYLALSIELLRLRSLEYSIRVDGNESQLMPGILVAVGNTRSYGGGMPICPDADPCDGKLDLTHVEPIGRLRLLRFFPLMLRGEHRVRHEVTVAQGHSIEVAAAGLVVYADGERVGTGSARISVVPGALRVCMPQEAS